MSPYLEIQEKKIIFVLRFLQWVNQPIWNLSFGIGIFATYLKIKVLVRWSYNPTRSFMLESPQVLFISAVWSFDNFTVIKTQIAVPQKLYIFDFRGINNVVTTNSYQFVGSVNFEGNSTTTGHYVVYLKYSTGVINISSSSIQHYSDSILESKQFMSTTHALVYISTSYLESENEVLQDYLLRLSSRGKFKTLSWDILGQHQHLSPASQSIFASVESLMMKLFMERPLSDINCLPTQWYLHWEKNAAAE